MKLKYYLRGLGIGIIVTAIIMGVATKDRNAMTDEEIKARAKELGLVEQRVLSDVIVTPIPEEQVLLIPTEAPVKEPVVLPEETEEPMEPDRQEMTPEPTEEPQKPIEDAPEPTEEPVKPTEAPAGMQQEENEVVTLVIKSGETSWSISKALYELGVLEDASGFDSFLCQNGYDKTIRIGEFKISKNLTYEEIAKIIAR